MAQNSSNEMQGLAGSLAIYLVALIVGLIPVAIPVFLASRPTHYVNPGIAAYTPPPATRLIPLLNRKMDAPMAVAEPEAPALNAMASAKLKQPAKPIPGAAAGFRKLGEASRPSTIQPTVHFIQPADRGSHTF